jgi:hypothetical protein
MTPFYQVTRTHMHVHAHTSHVTTVIDMDTWRSPRSGGDLHNQSGTLLVNEKSRNILGVLNNTGQGDYHGLLTPGLSG